MLLDRVDKLICLLKNRTCGVRIAIHGTDAELIAASCQKCSGLITIRRQCVTSSFFSFTWP